MARDLDDTKRSIGAESMEDNEKKALFNKFREGGGQVIDERRASRAQMFDKDKQKEFLRQKERSKSGPRDLQSAIREVTREQVSLGGRVANFFGRIRLYMRSRFQGVMDAGGNLSSKFLHLLDTTAQNKLLDLQLLTTPLIHPAQPELRTKLLAQLNRINNYYYELLLRLEKLYNEREFREILSRYKVNEKAHITPRSVGEPLRELFKRLYVLRNFSQGCNISLAKGLELQADLEKKDRVALRRNLEHGRKDLSYLFNTLLPKLHLALLNIIKRNYPMGDRRLEDFLGMGPEDEIGYYTHRLAREIRQAQDAQKEALRKQKGTTRTTDVDSEEGPADDQHGNEQEQDTNQVRVSSLPKMIQQGLLLMKEVPASRDKLISSGDSPLNYLEDDDKMFHIILLFEEMEREYSFMLTSNQLKIAVDYQAGKKVDVKQEMSDLYIDFNHVRELIEEYGKYTSENYKIERSAQYTLMQKSKMLHSLSINRTKTGKQLRERLGNLSSKIENILRRLLNDYNKDRHLLQNPEDVISFDIVLGEKKKLENVSVLNALIQFLQFAAAFRFRLQEGDLAGLGAKLEYGYTFDVEPEPGETQQEQE